MFFGKDQPESEGSRYVHPGIKSLPAYESGAVMMSCVDWMLCAVEKAIAENTVDSIAFTVQVQHVYRRGTWTHGFKECSHRPFNVYQFVTRKSKMAGSVDIAREPFYTRRV
jgi:hypothetical protein